MDGSDDLVGDLPTVSSAAAVAAAAAQEGRHFGVLKSGPVTTEIL